MNYYIQGNEEKSEEIKAAFKREGFSAHGYDYGDDGSFFFTHNKNKLVGCCSIYSGVVDIIKTHPDYKELELPVKPKFKVGDKVIYHGKECTITFMDDNFYDFDGGRSGCRIEKQDELLSPAPKPHYDISNFKPFDKVLVRNYDTDTWSAEWFSHYVDDKDGTAFVTTCSYRIQCIPFEGNEHLIGTTDMCAEQYINW